MDRATARAKQAEESIMKLPSFQFYPGDWMKDPSLRSVSLEARGLWIDMLCLLFESGRRGYLQHRTGKPVTEEQLARMTGCSAEQVSPLLRELEDSGVFSRTEHGTVYSRRMVKDEQVRQARIAAGKQGGNPRLNGSTDNFCLSKNEAKPNHHPNQNRGSSSSSSVSSSSSASEEKDTPQPPVGGLDAQGLFLIFWECCPLKAKKPKALTAFLKLKPDRSLLDRMLEAIELQKRTRAWRKNNGQFIPHPATWLSNRQWEDSVVPDIGGESVWDEFVGETAKEAS